MPTKAELMSRLAAARVEVVRLSALKIDISDLQSKNHELRMKAAKVPALMAREKEQAEAIAGLKANLILADLEIKKLKASAINHKTASDSLKEDFGLLAAKASERRRQDKTTIDSLNDDLKSLESNAAKTKKASDAKYQKAIAGLRDELAGAATAEAKTKAIAAKHEKAIAGLRDELAAAETKGAETTANNAKHEKTIASLQDAVKSLGGTLRSRERLHDKTIAGLLDNLESNGSKTKASDAKYQKAIAGLRDELAAAKAKPKRDDRVVELAIARAEIDRLKRELKVQ